MKRTILNILTILITVAFISGCGGGGGNNGRIIEPHDVFERLLAREQASAGRM